MKELSELRYWPAMEWSSPQQRMGITSARETSTKLSGNIGTASAAAAAAATVFPRRADSSAERPALPM